ncbi:MAG: hypothetical protein M0Z43_12390 [Acidithiobacillus sp.]|nr:hypothetical protein [Acidithiobacillus sp.]
MNRQITKRLIIIFIILLGSVFAYKLVVSIFRTDAGHPTGLYEDEISYEINPETILTSINTSETNVFTRIPATPEVYSPLASGSFSWDQTDYLTIANAFHNFVWKEDLQNWSLYSAEFLIQQCQNNFGGFDYAHFDYFQRQDKTYFVHGITIAPLYSEIASGETYYDYTSRWKSIDLTKIKISADDALILAEKYGGEQARLSVGNDDCRVRLVLAPYVLGRDWGWSVFYFKGNSKIFDISIDPYTGKYEILTR